MPIKIVKRLITPVIVTSPTFWLKEVSGRHPKHSEIVLENPSTARDPCSSSIFRSRPKAPFATAVVAPVVSAADTRNTIAIVKNAPRLKTGLWLVKRFFRNYPLLLLYPMYLNFASSNCLPHLPYIVRFIIFNLLLVPSTNPLL